MVIEIPLVASRRRIFGDTRDGDLISFLLGVFPSTVRIINIGYEWTCIIHSQLRSCNSIWLNFWICSRQFWWKKKKKKKRGTTNSRSILLLKYQFGYDYRCCFWPVLCDASLFYTIFLVLSLVDQNGLCHLVFLRGGIQPMGYHVTLLSLVLIGAKLNLLTWGLQPCQDVLLFQLKHMGYCSESRGEV